MENIININNINNSKILLIFDFDCTISIKCFGKFLREPLKYKKYNTNNSISCKNKEILVHLFLKFERIMKEPDIEYKSTYKLTHKLTHKITPKEYLKKFKENININFYNNLYNDFINELFGGIKRLDKLKNFFINLKNNGIDLIILSWNEKEYIDLCLEYINFNDIFKIYGRKEILEFHINKSKKAEKLDIIIKEYNVNNYNKIFLFDDDSYNYSCINNFFNPSKIYNKNKFIYFNAIKENINFTFYNYDNLIRDCMNKDNKYNEKIAGLNVEELDNIVNFINSTNSTNSINNNDYSSNSNNNKISKLRKYSKEKTIFNSQINNNQIYYYKKYLIYKNKYLQLKYES